MGDLTRNLSRSEFMCPCGCETDTADFDLINELQNIVDHFIEKYPDMEIGIHLNSANRCKSYNATIPGASPKSKHIQYQAVDFFIYDKLTGDYRKGIKIDPDEVSAYLLKTYPEKFGIGQYRGRTHFDIRQNKARWDKR